MCIKLNYRVFYITAGEHSQVDTNIYLQAVQQLHIDLDQYLRSIIKAYVILETTIQGNISICCTNRLTKQLLTGKIKGGKVSNDNLCSLLISNPRANSGA